MNKDQILQISLVASMTGMPIIANSIRQLVTSEIPSRRCDRPSSRPEGGQPGLGLDTPSIHYAFRACSDDGTLILRMIFDCVHRIDVQVVLGVLALAAMAAEGVMITGKERDYLLTPRSKF